MSTMQIILFSIAIVLLVARTILDLIYGNFANAFIAFALAIIVCGMTFAAYDEYKNNNINN